MTSSLYRAIAHDENVFHRPFDFDPNRFLPSKAQSKAEIDSRKLVFGYGRRVCPGESARRASST